MLVTIRHPHRLQGSNTRYDQMATEIIMLGSKKRNVKVTSGVFKAAGRQQKRMLGIMRTTRILLRTSITWWSLHVDFRVDLSSLDRHFFLCMKTV